MKHLLKQAFWPEPKPIIHDEVEPAPLSPDKEEEARAANYRMTEAVLASLNRSSALRVRLAEQTLAAVSGEHR